nr:MAG TPA: hypothetical protein [Myoviridae sp. ctRUJ25]
MNSKERFMRTCPTISKYHRMIMGYFGKDIPFKYSTICFMVRYRLRLI